MKKSMFCHSIASLLVMVSCGPPLHQAPYPPRGWRPNGPAFELPTENEIQELIKDINTSEVTPQSSAFQEYGTPTFQEEDQTNYLTIQQFPGGLPSQFYRQSEGSEFRSKLIEDLEAETEARETSTIEPECETTTLIESEFANIRTEIYASGKSSVFEDDEPLLTTIENGNEETVGYDEEKQIGNDETASTLSALNQNLKVSLVGEEALSILSTEHTEEVSEKQESSTMNGGEETTALTEHMQIVDVTTELYTPTAALAKDEVLLGTDIESGNIGETTFAPIVVLDLEEQAKNGKDNLVFFAHTQKSNDSDDFLSRNSNGTFQGVVIKNNVWSVWGAGNISTQSKTFIEKNSSQKQQQKVESGGNSAVAINIQQATTRTSAEEPIPKTDSQAELRNLDYTAPVGFAEYGTPFEQYGPPQPGARRLEVESTTGYELDSSTTNIVPGEPSTPVDNTSSDISRDGRKWRLSPKLRNIHAVFQFNGKGPESVNVL